MAGLATLTRELLDGLDPALVEQDLLLLEQDLLFVQDRLLVDRLFVDLFQSVKEAPDLRFVVLLQSEPLGDALLADVPFGSVLLLVVLVSLAAQSAARRAVLATSA